MPRKVTINYKKAKKVFKVDKMSDWEKVAEFLISKLKPGMVVALRGDLGAGKTTLTQYIAKQLGVSKRALSPTFALVKSYIVHCISYDGVKRMVHVDAYRIEDDRELLALDLDEELLMPGSVMILEWPERIEKWIAKQTELVQVDIRIT
jgi:tRNA threonylcarbamoyladenosine biosynthesis protein TsaE